MNITSYSRNVRDDGKISFPVLQCWNPVNKIASIAAQVNGKRIFCKISGDVLQKKFDAMADDPMNAVTENRTQIENAARKLIENDTYDNDGSILIEYRDLD